MTICRDGLLMRLHARSVLAPGQDGRSGPRVHVLEWVSRLRYQVLELGVGVVIKAELWYKSPGENLPFPSEKN